MTRLANLFTCSCRELRQVRTITICAMLGAVAIALRSVSIELGQTIRIGFSGIPNELIHYLFGPVVGSVFAGTMDVLKFIVKPTGAFFPGFTINAMIAGLIYGSFYYKKPVTLMRSLAAHFVVALVCNVLINTLCLSVLYSKGFMVLLPARLIKNLIMWPIDSLIFYQILHFLELSGVLRRMGLVSGRAEKL